MQHVAYTVQKSNSNIASYPSQPQPEPWMPIVAADIFACSASKDPNCALICVESVPALRTPPPSETGLRFCQKMEWLRCPPPLNLIAAYYAFTVAIAVRKKRSGVKHESRNGFIYLELHDAGDVALGLSLSELLRRNVQVRHVPGRIGQKL